MEGGRNNGWIVNLQVLVGSLCSWRN